MGQSSSTYQSQLLTELNQAVFSQLTNIQNNSANTCKTNQNLNVTIGPNGRIACTGTINFVQNNQTVCSNTATFTNTTTTQLTTALNNAIQQMATSNQSATQGFLTASLSQTSSASNTVSYIQNLISTNISNIVTNSCINSATVDQNNQLVINGVITDCTTFNASQNSSLNVVSQCVASNIFSILAQNSLVQQAAQTASASQTVVQMGPIDAIGNALKNLFSGTSGIIIAVIIVVVILVVIGYYVKKGGGGGVPSVTTPTGGGTTSASAGATIAANPELQKEIAAIVSNPEVIKAAMKSGAV